MPDGVGLNHKLSERVRGACEDLSEQAYDPGSVWPTFHLEIRGKSICVLIDGSVVGENVTSTLLATNGAGDDPASGSAHAQSGVPLRP